MSFFKESFDSKNRLYLGIFIVSLLAVYFLPLYVINLGGVQFTEPLSMYIWVSKITGGTDVDLYTINDFNHYIGMEKIYPEQIPELKIMPYILGYCILGAIITFFYNKIYMVYLGIMNLFALMLVGLYDFWRWLNHYGTNLDTSAPLYSSDIDFEPPWLGCKKILNVESCAYPYFGGYLLIIGFSMLFFILYLHYFKNKKQV